MNATKQLVWMALAALIVIGAGPARAQEGAAQPPSLSEMEKAQQEAERKLEAWLKASADFCKDTRLTEADLKKCIELAPSFEKMGDGEKEDEDGFDRFFKDGKVSFDYILKHPDYVKWVREHGVDGTQWLKKYLRLTLFLMREQSLKHMEMASAQFPQHLKQIEAMKGQVDDKMYEQMKKGLEASMAAMERTKKLYATIPAPTEDEAKLLKKYGPQIRQVMDDDGEEDDGCGELEEEDEDYDEEDDED